MAEFDSNITEPLNRLRAIQQGATSFASDVAALLVALVGDDNPFGTAATYNTGTSQGEVPLLGAGGRIEPSLLPAATDTDRGAVILARNLQDDRAGVVATAAQIAALTATAGDGLNAANFTITEITSTAGLTQSFTAPGTGLLLLASGGGSGHNPPNVGAYLGNQQPGQTTGIGSNGTDSSLRYDTTTLTINGGLAGGARVSGGVTNRGVRVETIQRSPNAPDFGITLFGKGGVGGDPGIFNPDTSVPNNEVSGVPGSNGNLFIAKFQAGRTMIVRFGDGGSPTSTTTASNQSRIPARRGLDGYALFVRLG